MKNCPSTRVTIEFYESPNHEYGLKPGTTKPMPRKQVSVIVPLPPLPQLIDDIVKRAIYGVIGGDDNSYYNIVEDWAVSVVSIVRNDTNVVIKGDE